MNDCHLHIIIYNMKPIQYIVTVLALCLALFFAQGSGQSNKTFELVQPCFVAYVQPNDVCGFVYVPEDRQDTNNRRQIKIAVIVRKATAPNPKPDPVVMLEGGPGVSGTARYATMGALALVNTHRDFILIDQRGSGYSQPLLDCSIEAQNASQFTTLAQLALCQQRLSTQTKLSAYSTEQNAEDVVAVVQALGYQSWNVIGQSYGTRLGLTMLNKNPIGLRSMVLDGVLGTHINASDLIVDVFAVWNRIFKQQKALINNIAREIEQGKNPTSISGLWWTLLASPDGNTLESRLRLIRNKLAIPTDPRVFTLKPTIDRNYSLGMALSVSCPEEFIRADFGQILRKFDATWNKSLIQQSLFEFSNRLMQCRAWNAQARERFDDFVKSGVPVLVLADTHDTQTPLEWATPTAQNLAQAQLVITKTLGHVISNRPCGAATSQVFIDKPVTVATDSISECANLLADK
jgi:pimeloyl-ACP methyl ester carboxylesterase